MFFYCCSSPKSIAVQRSFQELMYVHIVYMLEICWIYTMWLWYDVMWCDVWCMHTRIYNLSRVELLFFFLLLFITHSRAFLLLYAACHMREVILPLILFLSFSLCRSLLPPVYLTSQISFALFLIYIVVCSHVTAIKQWKCTEWKCARIHKHTDAQPCMRASVQIYCVEKAYNTFRIAFIMLFQKI